MAITVTRARQFLNDADNDGVADPGDTFTHTITVINGEATAAINLFITESENGIAIDSGSFKIGPVAMDDDLNVLEGGTITGNTPVDFTASQLLTNDFDSDDITPNLTITQIDGQDIFDNLNQPVEITLTDGSGTVTHDGAGNFTFHPAAGFEGAGSFTYAIEDADGIASAAATPGVVSFTVDDPVWYVDNVNGSDATGDGTFENPFATLAPLTTGGSADDGALGGDDADDTIFVYNNSNTINTGTIVLEDGQSLLGDGSSLTSVNGNSVGASTSNSDIGGGNSGVVVTLASGNEISGIDIISLGGTAVSGTNFGTLTVTNSTIDTFGTALSLNTGAIDGSGFTNTISSSGANNVSLTNVTGTLDLGNGVLSGATAASINVNGGSVDLEYDGSIGTSGGAAVNVVNQHSGTMSFDGNVSTSTGSGLQFNNADGTYNFNGTTTLNGGDAGVDIVNNSSGTFTFADATITHAGAGDAFVSDDSASNVTFNGDITDIQGNAVNIDNHDGGTITFQNGTINSSGAGAGGIDVTDSGGGGIVNFNGAVTLGTEATNNALTMTGNSGSTINFSGTGTGLDLFTVGGTALTFTGGGELNISGASNTIFAQSGKLIDINGGTTGTGIAFNTIQSGALTNGTAISINNLDADGNAGDGVESFTAGLITIFGTAATTSGDGINISGGASVKFDVDTVSIGQLASVDGDGVELNGANGEVDIDTLNIFNTNGQGLEIVGATQLVDIDAGTITPGANSDEAVLINTGSGNIDIGANLTKTTAGNIVEVQSHSSGTINLTGTLSATGSVANGILLNNSGGTIAFTGSAQTLTTGSTNAVEIFSNSANVDFTGGNLDITTTSGTGISAGTTATATGGTLTIDGSGNTLTATTGHALVVNGTDIDSVGVEFFSINKNGGTATGVFLKDTGSSGFFTVTGNGSVAGTGGTIQNIGGSDNTPAQGSGFYFENVSNVSLNNLDFSGTINNYGIRGFGVNNFTLRDSLVDASFGTYSAGFGQDEEGAIKFGTNNNGANGLTGTALFEGNTIGANVDTATGTYDTLAIFNNAANSSLNFTMRDNATSGDAAVVGKNSNLGNDGVHVSLRGSNSSATVLIDGVTFHGSRGDMVQTVVSGTGAPTLNTTITNNTMHNTHADITSAGGGLAISGGENPSNYNLTYNVSNNSIRGPEGQAIFVSTVGTAGTISGVIANNIIGVDDVGNPQASFLQASTGASTSNAIDIRHEKFLTTTGNPSFTHAVRIEGNQIRDFAQSGIYVRSNNQGGGDSRVEATIKNNIIEEVGPTTFGGISVIASGASAGDTGKLGLVITGNTVNLDNSSGLDGDNNAILVDQVFATGEIYVPGVDASGNGNRGEAVPPAGGLASARLTDLWDPTNTLTNGEFPNAIGEKVDATQVKNLTSNAFVLAVPILATNPGNNGWEIDNPLPTPTVPTDDGDPDPYVDPTPQDDPVPTTDGDGDDGDTPPTDDGGDDDTGGTDDGGTEPPAPTPVVHDLTQAELDTMVEAAIERWAAIGATPEQIAAMRATNFSIADMSGFFLGSSTAGAVTVDSDGAGRGWFVDSTPGEDSEFAGDTSRLVAELGGAAAGRMDLLTVVMHELGHQVGLDDIYDGAEAHELMYGFARVGERRLPAADDLVHADMSHIGHEVFLESSPTVASLPAGKGVVFEYTSTVLGNPNGFIGGPFNNISTVETDNFANVVSTQEQLVVDGLVLGGTVWEDEGGTTGIANNGLLDGDEAGIVGVSVTLFADDGDTAGVWDANDTAVVGGTDITDANGEYQFTGLDEGDYIVRIDLDNFDAGGNESLLNLQISPLTSPDQPDPDDDADDNDDNGARAVGEAAYSKAITLTFNGEPTSDGGTVPQNDVNTTLDFGFLDNPPPAIADLGGDSVTFFEDGAAVRLDDASLPELAASVTDDQANLNGGSLTVSITANEDSTDDVLGIFTLGGPGDIQLSDGTNVGSVVSIGVVAIGTISSDGTGGDDLVIDFDTDDATPANVTTIVQALTYFNGDTENPSTAARTVSVTVDDGLGGFDTQTVTVNVTAQNDAPVLIDSGALLTDVAEDAGAPSGAVGWVVTGDHDGDSVITDNVTDPDGPSGGIALTGVDSTNGDWFYSTDGGANWTAVPAVADNSALLLLADGNTRLYFQPDANFNGTISEAISFRAWDASSGSNGDSGVDTTTNGDTTAFSTASDTASLEVTPVNDKPDISTSPSVSVDEQETVTLNASMTLSDADLDALNGGDGDYAGMIFAIGQGTPSADDLFSFDTTGASFTVDGTDLKSGGQIFASFDLSTPGILGIAFTSAETVATTALVNEVLQRIQYTNDSDEPPASVQLVYGVDDGAPDAVQGVLAAVNDNVDGHIVTVNITAINDVPVVTPGLDADTLEDNAVALTGVSITDDSGTEEITVHLSVEHGTLTILDTVVGGIDSADITGGGQGTRGITLTATVDEINTTLAAAGGLTYTPDANFNGADGLTVSSFEGVASDPRVNGGITSYGFPPNGPVHLVSGDLDGDGTIDLAYALGASDMVVVRPNSEVPPFPFASPFTVNVGDNPSSVALGDMNGDGDLDIVVANYAAGGFSPGSVGILYNNGTGGFAPMQTVAPNVQSAYDVVVGDFNEDGRADIAVDRRDFGLVEIILQNTDGSFATPVVYAANSGLYTKSITQGDLNGDGHLDIIAFNTGDAGTGSEPGTISVLLGNGDGTFAAAVPIATGLPNPWEGLAVDVTGDGILDVVYTTIGSTDGVFVLKGAGNGTTFTPHSNFLTPAGVSGVAAGDVNGDGRPDLVLSVQGSPGTGTFVLLNPDGTVNSNSTVALGTNPESVALGDFDSDGDIDFGFLNASGETTVVGNGTLNLGAVATKTINVASVNDAPSGADKTVTVDEDDEYEFSEADFGFTDPNDGNAFASIIIESLPANGDLYLDGVLITSVPANVTATDIGDGKLTFKPDADANGGTYAQFDFKVVDDGGDNNGGLDTAVSENTITVDVTAINDAPVNSLGGTIGTGEDAIDAWLSGMSIDDVDAGSNDITVTFAVDNGILEIATGVAGGIVAADITGGAQNSGSITVTATLAEINATLAAANGLTYSPDANYFGDDTLTVTTNDGGNSGDDPGAGGTGDLTSEEDVDTRTITISAVDDPGTANDDEDAVFENAVATGSVFADNGNGVDVDVDGLKVVKVNNVTADVGQEILLGSGALLTLNEDGTYSYDPNGVFDYLAKPSSGASNIPATDSFSYELEGGETATVTITINGVDTDDLLIGTLGDDTLEAGIGDDEVRGRDGSDVIDGQAGNDLIDGGEGDDLVSGGADNDRISGRAGIDFLLGGGGNDELVGHGDDDLLVGGAGLDLLIGSYGDDILDGGGDNDVLEGEYGWDELYGAGGNDRMRGGGGFDLMDGGTGDDEMFGDDGQDVMYGCDGEDDMLGGTGNDAMYGEAQNDVVDGGFGDDAVFGNGGDDRLNGRSGDDQLEGGIGNDELLGHAGGDTLLGGDGTDLLNGGRGGDVINGQVGADEILGGSGFDAISGGGGDDAVRGGAGNDGIDGNVGEDSLYGDEGNDTLNGGDNADFLDGGLGADTIDGGSGADVIRGGLGGDTLTGGGGADGFFFNSAFTAFNVDSILDYSVADDTIFLARGVFQKIDFGTLDAAAFGAGTAATDADDRILYDAATGNLFYDADGSGTDASAVLFATVTAGTALTNADFVVYPG